MDYLKDSQEIREFLAIGKLLIATELSHRGTAPSLVKLKLLSAFNHPPLEVVTSEEIKGLTRRTKKLIEPTPPSASLLVYRNLETGAVSSGTLLNHTITLPGTTQVTNLRLTWGEMGPDFNEVTVLGLREDHPTWVRLGAWCGQDSRTTLSLPLDGAVKTLRIQCHGCRPIGLYEAQVFGTPLTP